MRYRGHAGVIDWGALSHAIVALCQRLVLSLSLYLCGNRCWSLPNSHWKSMLEKEAPMINRDRRVSAHAASAIWPQCRWLRSWSNATPVGWGGINDLMLPPRTKLLNISKYLSIWQSHLDHFQQTILSLVGHLRTLSPKLAFFLPTTLLNSS